MGIVLIINHRINTIKELYLLPLGVPVEVDIHAYGDRIVVQHDAMKDGPDFCDWLDAAGRRFAILNIKEEGIENKVLKMAENSSLEDFFLLDISFPALIRMVRSGEKRLALRVSEYENYNVALKLTNKIGWIWLDCFDGFPLNKSECEGLVGSGAKICLVSPELHGPHRTQEDILAFKSLLQDYAFPIEAVCTKQPELWRSFEIKESSKV